MEIESFRTSMSGDVLHSWAADAQKEIQRLRAELAACRAHREDELNIAFHLGQTYWQQADSESYAENKRSAATKAKFHALIARKGEGE